MLTGVGESTAIMMQVERGEGCVQLVVVEFQETELVKEVKLVSRMQSRVRMLHRAERDRREDDDCEHGAE